jgi:CRP/FNR family transcriptional activator FtrB
MLGYMSARLKRLIAQIADLKLMTGPQRLAHFIIMLLERGGDAHSARLPFEKRTLAALLGMTPESLSRAFRRLGGLGVSTASGGDIVVADIEQLRKFIETEIVA